MKNIKKFQISHKLRQQNLGLDWRMKQQEDKILKLEIKIMRITAISLLLLTVAHIVINEIGRVFNAIQQFPR